MIYHENVDAVSGPRVVPSDVVVGTTQKNENWDPPHLSLCRRHWLPNSLWWVRWFKFVINHFTDIVINQNTKFYCWNNIN